MQAVAIESPENSPKEVFGEIIHTVSNKLPITVGFGSCCCCSSSAAVFVQEE